MRNQETKPHFLRVLEKPSLATLDLQKIVDQISDIQLALDLYNYTSRVMDAKGAHVKTLSDQEKKDVCNLVHKAVSDTSTPKITYTQINFAFVCGLNNLLHIHVSKLIGRQKPL